MNSMGLDEGIRIYIKEVLVLEFCGSDYGKLGSGIRENKWLEGIVV